MLHISPEEQKARLGERLARPDKHWKFNPGDIDERAHWPAYMEAYHDAVTRCSTEVAPWYVVPADRKWYARLAVTNLVLEHLEAMDPQWPKADFDVAEQQARYYREEAGRKLKLLTAVVGGAVYAGVGVLVVVMIVKLFTAAYLGPLNDAQNAVDNPDRWMRGR